jgi:hypothetical protein
VGVAEIVAAVAALERETFGDVAGLNVYEHVPESVTAPAIVNAPTGGVDTHAHAGHREVEFTLRIDFLLSRHTGGGLAGADRALRPYLDKVLPMLWRNQSFGGAANGLRRIEWQYGLVIDYGGTEYLGARFEPRVYFKTRYTT